MQPAAMPRQNTTTRAPRAGAIDPDRLDELLGGREDEHTTLLQLAHEHKQSLTHADPESLKRVTMQTSEVLMRIARIERERQGLITQGGHAVDTLDQLLERFDHDDRQRISQRRQRLRELIERVRDEQQAVKLASEQLANHMKGLMKQVSASLSHAGTYSRGGTIDTGRSQVVSGLDTIR